MYAFLPALYVIPNACLCVCANIANMTRVRAHKYLNPPDTRWCRIFLRLSLFLSLFFAAALTIDAAARSHFFHAVSIYVSNQRRAHFSSFSKLNSMVRVKLVCFVYARAPRTTYIFNACLVHNL